jgi:hypothetical protein
MCIFSPGVAARSYGDHEAERNRRSEGQRQTLAALHMQKLRGDKSLFLKSPAVPLQMSDL